MYSFKKVDLNSWQKTSNVCFRICFLIIVRFSNFMFVTSDQPYHLLIRCLWREVRALERKSLPRRGLVAPEVTITAEIHHWIFPIWGWGTVQHTKQTISIPTHSEKAIIITWLWNLIIFSSSYHFPAINVYYH